MNKSGAPKAVRSYYDGALKGVVKYRISPPPFWWVGWDAWKSVRNGFSGFRLRVTDDAIEVRCFGRFGRRLLEVMGPGLRLWLPPRETTMGAVRVGRNDLLALSCSRSDGSEYTLAVRPADRDFDRLRNALKRAGVRENQLGSSGLRECCLSPD